MGGCMGVSECVCVGGVSVCVCEWVVTWGVSECVCVCEWVGGCMGGG